jgi:peptide/nickel transport system ATP-binding protein
MSDRILVMYAGRIVEEHQTQTLLRDPLHPYSKGLLGSYADPRDETVRITYIPGRPPDLSREQHGCRFAARCPEKIERCLSIEPALLPIVPIAAGALAPVRVVADAPSGEPSDLEPRVACHVAHLQREAPSTPGLPAKTRRFQGPEFVKSVGETEVALSNDVFLQVKNVTKTFRTRRGFTVEENEVIKGVSFELRRGMVTALVGQSGSGKSTIARMITGVESPTSGEIVFQSKSGPLNVGHLGRADLARFRKLVQMVFQDPYSSLNPNKTLDYILSRPLKNHRNLGGKELRAEIDSLLEAVALTPPGQYRGRYGYELSGGQRQRVVIARALAAQPELVIADEPISSLDVSIRAEILKLLHKLVQDSDVGILYITHDLLSARMLADEVIVLHNGEIVERGEAIDVIRNPKDDYTRRLVEAIPNPFAETLA